MALNAMMGVIESSSRNVEAEVENDRNDSRWTLKYRDPAEELVQLIEHSSVYLNADKLAECKRLSSDSVTLARILLPKIFTKSALSVYSVNGDDTDSPMMKMR